MTVRRTLRRTLRRLVARSLPSLLLVGCGALWAGCGGGVRASTAPDAVLAGLAKSDVERLSKKRIYFGHQSVGYNIVDGLAAVEKDHPDLRLAIKETSDPAQITSGVFAHGRVGQNEAPSTKIRGFATTLEGGVGDNVDVAFFKFCYIDFNADTDTAKLFTEYKAAITELHRKYSRVKIVHVTVPLAVAESGPKEFIKRLIGKKSRQIASNISRNRYNELLRREYSGKEPLFDLAAIEATRPDGATATFDDGGSTYPMLAAEYASDGKHLNALGGRWVASHLVKFLADLAD